jgi:uncharacterized protein (TIGR00730 family)
MNDMKNICVFCSAAVVEYKYEEEATKFGSTMVAHGYGLVWGGSNKGIMKTIADSVETAGGRLTGISVVYFKDVARPGATEMIVTPNLAERKKLLLDRADAIVLLVGGLGSLDEIAEIIELKKIGLHHKPIAVLNSYGFYNDFKNQLEKMYQEKFINKPIDDLIHFADTPENVISYINSQLSNT